MQYVHVFALYISVIHYVPIHNSLFEQVSQRPGGSPTEAILSDWGTTNARVSDLLKILGDMDHFSAMDAVLPGD